jgi:hypothetical protein
MKSLTDFHYWFIYVFFNKGPSKKWTIKRKKRNLNFISTVFKSICNISKIVSIYTPILCILPSIPSLERGSSPWNDCYAWKKRYSLSITSCIIRFFKKYIHKFIKKIEKFNSSIFHLALLEWLELTYAIHFWNKKANLVLIARGHAFCEIFSWSESWEQKSLLCICTIKVESSLHVTFAKLAQICLTSRTRFWPFVQTIKSDPFCDPESWPRFWPLPYFF